ncbi:MAG: glutamate-1-semialdehyde 2,1-aminomutase [Armatimonadetes bacterium]|nr:glutamate-1-semialdehyde 2,1-aminomutase [Armatimonadota bacterium]
MSSRRGGTARDLYARAVAVMPGGVNSPVRAFRGVGGAPRFFVRGHGPFLVDTEAHELVDYVMSWGPLILGHAHPVVVERVSRVLGDGLSFGAATPGEVALAEAIIDTIPAVDMVRLVNSGTEASMSAIRLARGFTGRDRVVKFDGCYHGHVDSLLVAAGSGVATFGLPDSPGVPSALAELTHSLPYADLDAMDAHFDRLGAETACVIVETVAGNMGVVEPPESFLTRLRERCNESGALLVFDEVMTGLRVALGGAQERYQVYPDLTVMGKIIGGGMPLAAYGGRSDIMAHIAPAGPVYQAGTLSGNPVAVACGLATLEVLDSEPPYDLLEARSARLARGLHQACERHGVEHCINRVGAMLTLFFQAGPVTDYAAAKRSDTGRFASFFHAMLQRGVYLPPSQYEAWFPSVAHTDAVIDQTIEAADEALAACVKGGWPRP